MNHSSNSLLQYLVVLLIAAVCLGACATSQQTATTTDEQQIKEHRLTGTWSLEKVYDRQINDEEYMRAPFLALKPDEGNANGNSSCNTFSGKVTVRDNTIAFGEIISTKMYCEKSVEESFMKALKEANRYELKGTQLFLYQDDTLVARLIKS